MADVTMAHPDYLAAPQAVRYDGPIGPELWRVLHVSLETNRGRWGVVVMPDGLRIEAYYERADELTVRIDRRGATTDEAWAAYITAILSVLPDGEWLIADTYAEPCYRMTVLKCTRPAPAKEAA